MSWTLSFPISRGLTRVTRRQRPALGPSTAPGALQVQGLQSIESVADCTPLSHPTAPRYDATRRIERFERDCLMISARIVLVLANVFLNQALGRVPLDGD